MKRARKGFTLVELLIVIVIIGILAAAMMVSSSKANAAAKASTIYTNISAIRTSAVIYQLQQGLSFKESGVSDTNLKNDVELDLSAYNGSGNNIKYAIVPGKDKAGAYVICSFADDGDYEGIEKALANYKNIRLSDSNHTVGAFLYHNTPDKYNADAKIAYDCDFEYPSGDTEDDDDENGGTVTP